MQKIKVTLFSTTTCPLCQSAKEAIEKLNLKVNVVVIDESKENMAEYYYWAETATVPTILLQRPSSADADKLDMSDSFVYEGFKELPNVLKKLAEWI